MKYDYLIVGSGLFGATFAHFAQKAGKKCLVIDKRSQIGGNVYCEKIKNITVHKYGAHIFHTSNKRVWDFVNQFVSFNNYSHSVVAKYKSECYNLPFNMNTFYQLWRVTTPIAAKKIIAKQKERLGITNPKNLEEQAICLVGVDIYQKLIKEYTEKQWGRLATSLPAFIIKRLPVRFTYDNNYFNDHYQGIPIGGYNKLIQGLLKDVEVCLNVDYFSNRYELNSLSARTVFTGRIDEFFDFKLGKLGYRSLKFDSETLKLNNFQGCSVMNYIDATVPFTRIIEHKHFELPTQDELEEYPETHITREYPEEWREGLEPYYPINDEQNSVLYSRYQELAHNEPDVRFGGRLAEFRYYDMDQVIEQALLLADRSFGQAITLHQENVTPPSYLLN